MKLSSHSQAGQHGILCVISCGISWNKGVCLPFLLQAVNPSQPRKWCPGDVWFSGGTKSQSNLAAADDRVTLPWKGKAEVQKASPRFPVFREARYLELGWAAPVKVLMDKTPPDSGLKGTLSIPQGLTDSRLEALGSGAHTTFQSCPCQGRAVWTYLRPLLMVGWEPQFWALSSCL